MSFLPSVELCSRNLKLEIGLSMELVHLFRTWSWKMRMCLVYVG